MSNALPTPPPPAIGSQVNQAPGLSATWATSSGSGLTKPDGTVVLLGSGAGINFASIVTATLGASQNNYAPTGYVAGTTNNLQLTAISGGSTITGLLAATAGWSLYMYNASTAYTITLSNLSGSSSTANQFACPQGSSLALPTQTGAILIYNGSQWTFA